MCKSTYINAYLSSLVIPSKVQTDMTGRMKSEHRTGQRVNTEKELMLRQ